MAIETTDSMVDEYVLTQCTQPSVDPRRMGRNNSGLSASDVADVICILHPASPAAFRLVSDTAARAPQHILQNSSLRRPDRNGAALDDEETFILNENAGEQAMDLALRFSTRTHQPHLGFVIGRNSEACDIVVRADSHKRVSNFHFCIFFNETGILMLRDMSTNGTMVDDVLLKCRTTHHPHSRILSPGSVVQILSPSKDEVLKFIVRFPSRDGYYQEYDKMFQDYMSRQFAALERRQRDGRNDDPHLPTSAQRRHTAVKAPVPHNQFGMHWNGGEVYNVVGHIGKGAFASVYQLATKIDGQLYAAKELEKRRFMKNGVLDRKLENEMRIMQSIDHPSIVAYHDYQDVSNHLYIIMEFVPCGDLQQYLTEYGPLPESIAKQMASQVFDALDYLHKKNITHRDIKPDNILLSSIDPKNFLIKLSDFGLSKAVQNNDTFLKTFCGTLLYCAPEVFPHYDTHSANKGIKRSRKPQGTKTFRSYSHAVDIWSFGAVLWYSLCHRPPFEGVADNTGRGMFDKIMMTPLDAADLARQGVSEAAVALLVAMLNTDPMARPSAEECLRLPWFGSRKPPTYRRPQRSLGAIQEEAQLDTIPGAQEPDVAGLSLDERDVDELMGSQQSEVSLNSSDMNFFESSRVSKRLKTGDDNHEDNEEVDEDNYYGSSPELVGDIPIMHQEQVGGQTQPRAPKLFGEISQSDLPTLRRQVGRVAENLTSSAASRGEAVSEHSLGQDAQDDRSQSLLGAESMVREMEIDSPFTGISSASQSQRDSNSVDSAAQSQEAQPDDLEETPKLQQDPQTQAHTYTRRISIPDPPSFYHDPANPSTHNLQYASEVSSHDYTKAAKHAAIKDTSLATTQPRSKPTSDNDGVSANDSMTNAAYRVQAESAKAPKLPQTAHLIKHANISGPRPRFGRLISTQGSAPDLVLDLHTTVTTYGRSSRCTYTHPDKNDIRIAKECLTIFFHASDLSKASGPEEELDSIKGLYCGIVTYGSNGVKINGFQLDKGEVGKQLYGKIHTGDIIEVWPGNDKQAPLRFYVEVYHGTTKNPRSPDAPGFEVAMEKQRSESSDNEKQGSQAKAGLSS
ncbi:uncharacterized protein MYCFIDRAFT_212922 [Pseudocercospora fijiensis CIRAD86]|uniref:Autophagy-related protein 1 n=1 Tax=Pseudocercospora fijiensis (strain CIRAD86) TaxID=383855 RepID=N1Q9F9_PSEFD|nr:uncharacterized protein MYCFIDRAFT_212922 [Pseudocercospora fijiensis CIRAD86]EME87527.1 hypothetical protein MYCFIDRAFT_212922 [Pseudocercospora fijiensis CIRAD86]